MKRVDFLLYQNLIESDYLIINNELTTTLKTKKYNLINQDIRFLDLFILIKEIKQFLLLLKFIKKKNGYIKIIDSNLEENSSIYFKIYKRCNRNFQYSEEFLDKKNYNKKNLFKFKKNYKLLLNFNKDQLSKSLIFSFFKHFFFLVENISMKNSLQNLSFYKIFNNIQEDYKKLIFTLLLIKKI